MALTQYDVALGADKVTIAGTKTHTVTAVTGGATSLGGTSEIRILIDDAVATSKLEVLRAIEWLEAKIVEDTWPPA